MRGMIQPTSEQPAGQDAAALLEQIHEGPVPAHVAVIMDGNGRWARQRGLPRWEGHRAGMSSVREVIEGAAAARVQHLTLYAFSKENWARPKAEVAALMGLLEEYIAREKEELIRSRIRVSVFGEFSVRDRRGLSSPGDAVQRRGALPGGDHGGQAGRGASYQGLAGPGPADPDIRGAADLQFPALADSLRGDLRDPRPVA